MSSEAQSTEPMPLHELQDQIGSCADGIHEKLGALAELMRRLSVDSRIVLSDGKVTHVPTEIRQLLGVGHSEGLECWALLEAAAARDKSMSRGLENAIRLALACDRFDFPEAPKRVRCCSNWLLSSSYFLWRRSPTHHGILVQPSIMGGDGTLLPVLSCPFCGQPAPQEIEAEKLGRSSAEVAAGRRDRLDALGVVSFLGPDDEPTDDGGKTN